MQSDVIIIGGGIVGLATAYQILRNNPRLKLTLIEKESEVARHQTGNNSGVIHSGIYYKPGSLKATNCITGYNQLLQFCDQYGVRYELCGKIIVATAGAEIPLLKNLFNRGIENGLTGLRMLGKEELKEYEPHVNGLAGIHVPQTGIIDYKEVALMYSKLIQQAEGKLLFNEKVIDLQPGDNKVIVASNRQTYSAKLVVNCAGLYSDKIANLTVQKLNVKIIPFRGEYYKLRKEKEYLVRNLIYPVPDPNFPFLGVHFTRMIKGGVEAGPNAVLAFKREGYRKSDVNMRELMESLTWPGFQKVAWKYWRTGMGEMYRSFSKAAFTKALQKLLPEIQQADLIDGGAGVRAQACNRTGGLVDDFLILEDRHVINVCNAPSPAATSSLAIGQTITEKVLKRLS
ncbi:MAG: L-2-hydroxyglutarate oxidase [Flammeovirgaceae bacterium]|nr:MAG: L-2-hydroxyglutarate oxidase [Flammeovirgaceae bacterium]